MKIKLIFCAIILGLSLFTESNAHSAAKGTPAEDKCYDKYMACIEKRDADLAACHAGVAWAAELLYTSCLHMGGSYDYCFQVMDNFERRMDSRCDDTFLTDDCDNALDACYAAAAR